MSDDQGRTAIEGARFSHEWDVVGDAGAGRFVECDEGGDALDRRRYREFRAAEARGELVYLGIRRHEPGEQVRSLGGTGGTPRTMTDARTAMISSTGRP